MRNSLVLSTLLLFSFTGFSQAENDNIANRIELELDSAPVNSTTHMATVEWNCINKALTNTCLDYHNDQWFYFQSFNSNKQYLNITNQHCKNFKGVQVVIIEGNPCETSTYRLVHCTSFTDQNDVFITLDSLQAEMSYLVLIDGFLGDQCDFDIQLSTKPTGFPVSMSPMNSVSLHVQANHHQVELQWQVAQQQLDVLGHFEIFRQHTRETRAIKLTDISVETNALGKHIEQYSYTDTVTKSGIYTYRIAGVSKSDGKRSVLAEKQIRFYPSPKQFPSGQYIIEVPVNFSMPGEVEIIVSDARRGNALFAVTVHDGRNITVPFEVSRYVNEGIRFFRIRTVHLKSRNSISQTFALDSEGKWIGMTR